MIEIDYYAYSNKLYRINPVEKFVFALITMAICLVSPSIMTPIAVAGLMAVLLKYRAGIPFKVFVRLMSLPISFLLIGTAVIAFSIAKSPEGFWMGISLGGFSFGIRLDDLLKAVHLFFKSMGTISALYFLSLTTPMIEIMSVLRRFKVPGLFVELMGLTYRFIFVLMEASDVIRRSQSSRLGYGSFKKTMNSMSLMFSALFIRSIYRSKALSTALESRCYTGDIQVLEKDYPVSGKNHVFIFAVEMVLISLMLI